MTGLHGGQLDFAQACARARCEPAEVVRDLLEGDRDAAESSARCKHRVLSVLCLEVMRGLSNGKAQLFSQDRASARREILMRVDARTDRSATERHLGERLDVRAQPLLGKL